MCSGSSGLYWSLTNNLHIQGCKHLGERLYTSNSDLYNTSRIKHKSKSKKSFYVDEVLFNHLLSTKIDYTKLILINFIRRPKETLESIIHFKRIDAVFALRYYQYRLNRIYQISKIAQKSIFLKFESLAEDTTKELEEFLEIKIQMSQKQLDYFKTGFKAETVPKEYLSEAESCYEKYHYLLTKKRQDQSEESLLLKN